MDTTASTAPASPAAPITTVSKLRIALIILIIIMGGLVVGLVLNELRTSRLQSRFFSAIAQDATFKVKPGISPVIRFPEQGGPYDQRMGYAHLPHFLKRLQVRGYTISAQANQSEGMATLADGGVTAPLLPLNLFLPYKEKDQTGITVNDSQDQLLYQFRSPQRVFSDFNAIPSLLVNSLLYIENQTLLEPGNQQRNPAVEWLRFGKALTDQAVHLADSNYHAPGASTLATQIEKFRHSPEGRTGAPVEKLRQMLSASVRAYMYGQDTTYSRQQLVVRYLRISLKVDWQ